MPFVTLGTPAHNALTGVTATQHHTATVAGDLDYDDLADVVAAGGPTLAELATVTDGSNADASHAHVDNPGVTSNSQMEAATDNNVYVTPVKLTRSPGVVKTWLNYTQAATPVIEASHNIASVTDTGAGDFSPQIATDYSVDTYNILATMEDVANLGFAQNPSITNQAVGSYQCESFVNGGQTDAQNKHVSNGDF